MRVAIGSHHAGFTLKEALKGFLTAEQLRIAVSIFKVHVHIDAGVVYSIQARADTSVASRRWQSASRRYIYERRCPSLGLLLIAFFNRFELG